MHGLIHTAASRKKKKKKKKKGKAGGGIPIESTPHPAPTPPNAKVSMTSYDPEEEEDLSKIGSSTKKSELSISFVQSTQFFYYVSHILIHLN